ncbi:hypothetical protein [Dyadobacter bucti]|uniref:hypothetical protein n=1 Tax=Dyadobacter bucti TaxID=2572203 RepID=UPI001107AAC3|nr:hypothetical protein [Dyadobacter bucti]
MSTFEYPEVGTYKLPKKNVLVISCIDLRLTDNLLNFLHFDNLTNRYDHFALAGTSLCTTIETNRKHFIPKMLSDNGNFEHWRKTLFDHLELARTLHDIRDVYIVEHADCGAYKAFLTEKKLKEDEKKCHKEFAVSLAKEIHEKEYTAFKEGEEDAYYNINVHCFFIDLRGNVSYLESLHKADRPIKKKEIS